MVCPNCGMENEAGVSECIVCGTPLSTKEISIKETKTDNTISNILIKVGIIELVLSFGVWIYSF